MSNDDAPLQLPMLIATPADVSRLLREVGALDEYMRQQALRAPGQSTGKLPKTSRLLDELADANKLNLLEEHARGRLSRYLKDLSAHAPIVHVSFAVDPSSAFLQKLVIWFRENMKMPVLIRVGLQPAIAAGCSVRTTNKSFDFSLSKHLLAQRHFLRDALATNSGISAPKAQVSADSAPASEVMA